jgi:hypothetical protein
MSLLSLGSLVKSEKIPPERGREREERGGRIHNEYSF